MRNLKMNILAKNCEDCSEEGSTMRITVIDFEETEINSEDDISIEMIIDLFENVKQDEIKAFQSLIILKYESLRDLIINYKIP